MKTIAVCLVSFVLCGPLSGADPASPSLPLSFQLFPGISFPVAGAAAYFGIGQSARVSAEYRLPPLPLVFLRAGIGYSHEPIIDAEPSISVISAQIGAGARLDLGSRFVARAGVSGGYSFQILHGVQPAGFGGDPCIEADAGVDFFLTPTLSLGVRGAYTHVFRLYDGISVLLGASYEMDGQNRRGQQMQRPEARPQPLETEGIAGRDEGLQIRDVEWDPVFPVFHTYYDDHRIGTATLANLEKDTITDITLSLQVKSYMDSPKECLVPAQLKAGESRAVDLNALFTDRILEITEGTKAPVDLTLKYKLRGRWYKDARVETIRIQNRNAMTWDDDRRPAAFVTRLDPTIQTLSNNIINFTKAGWSRALDVNLVKAMAIYEAMRLYGISYQIDPTSSYAELWTKKREIDLLKFPRQTLEHRAGDCDDLSILFSALLESIAVPAAFITVPGHIYIAVGLDTTADKVRETMAKVGDLIFLQDSGRVWLPVELTERQAGFLKAWESGARQWREYSARNQARLYPVEEAWKTYEAVQLPGVGSPLALPSEDKIARTFMEEQVRYIDGEIFPQVAKFTAEIKKSGESASLINKLGVLYATYGLYDRAEMQFRKALEKQKEYPPALLNMGNIAYLREDMDKALEYYSTASRLEPDNPRVLLGLAQVNHKLENYGAAAKAYGRLKQTEPGLAAEFAYLDLRGEEAARAADISKTKGVVAWAAEE